MGFESVESEVLRDILWEMCTGQLISGERMGLGMQTWGHHCVSNGAGPEVAEIAQEA